jgi:hypothetical protein
VTDDKTLPDVVTSVPCGGPVGPRGRPLAPIEPAQTSTLAGPAPGGRSITCSAVAVHTGEPTCVESAQANEHEPRVTRLFRHGAGLDRLYGSDIFRDERVEESGMSVGTNRKAAIIYELFSSLPAAR